MKRTYPGWLLAVILAGTSLTLQAADVTITVNGKVMAKPCIVSTTASTVELENLYTSSLVSPGSSSKWHTVELELSECPVGTSQVTASFSGVADDSTGYYKNEGTAGNIQLELQDNSGHTLNTGTTMSVQVDDLQFARFPLQVRALSVSGGATQGTIQAVINVTYTYA